MTRKDTEAPRVFMREILLLAIATLSLTAIACEKERAKAPTNSSAHHTSSHTGATTSEAPSSSEGGKRALEKPAPEVSDIVSVRSDTIPASPQKIISLAPNITEILFALGLGDRVVGVTRFCDWPAEAGGKKKVGGFIDPDMEVILSLEPDLVLGMTAGDAKIADRLADAKIPHVFFKMPHFDATYKGIAQLAEVVGEEEKGGALVSKMRARTHLVATASQARIGRSDSPPTALFVLGHKPLIVAGAGTFGDELITLSGARNAARALEGEYPQIDVEKLLAMDPEIIVDSSMVPGESNEAFWGTFTTLSAVKNGRVATFDNPSLLRPGPRLPDALELFARAAAPAKSKEK